MWLIFWETTIKLGYFLSQSWWYCWCRSLSKAIGCYWLAGGLYQPWLGHYWLLQRVMLSGLFTGKKRFPALFENALMENKKYLLQVIKFIQKKLSVKESCSIKTDALAEGANNASMVFCFRSANVSGTRICTGNRQIEISHWWGPVSGSRGKLFVGRRWISRKQKVNISDDALNNFNIEVSKIFDLLTLYSSEDEKEVQLPNFDPLKNTLNEPAFKQNLQFRFIRVEFEKIIFELEAIFALLTKGDRI